MYLFDLLRTYDLRFVVAADRYAYPGEANEHVGEPGGGMKRSIEDIKGRYYTICRRLVRSRPTGDEAGKTQLLQYYAFDRGEHGGSVLSAQGTDSSYRRLQEREVARKVYASSLFHLTPAQIAEEEALYLECKRMEQQEKKFKADREDLMRMLAGFESGFIPLPGLFDKVRRVRRSVSQSPSLTASSSNSVPPPPPLREGPIRRTTRA